MKLATILITFALTSIIFLYSATDAIKTMPANAELRKLVLRPWMFQSAPMAIFHSTFGLNLTFWFLIIACAFLSNQKQCKAALEAVESVVEIKPKAIKKASPSIFQDSIETPRMTLKDADLNSKLVCF